MTIAVGLSTIISVSISSYVMLSQIKAQKKEHQPIFTINYMMSKTDSSEIYDVENFIVENIGEQMLSPAKIDFRTYIETKYYNTNEYLTAYYPLTYYYNASACSGNLVGEIMMTLGNEYIQNNLKLYNLYKEALEYSNNCDTMFLSIKKIDLFVISYVDIYGENQVCYYCNNNLISQKTYDSIIQESKKAYNIGIPKSIDNIELKDILTPILVTTTDN